MEKNTDKLFGFKVPNQARKPRQFEYVSTYANGEEASPGDYIRRRRADRVISQLLMKKKS